MSSPKELGSARPGSRGRPDLRQQYRPIGIGAVAAALAVAGDRDNHSGNSASGRPTEYGYSDSMAA